VKLWRVTADGESSHNSWEASGESTSNYKSSNDWDWLVVSGLRSMLVGTVHRKTAIFRSTIGQLLFCPRNLRRKPRQFLNSHETSETSVSAYTTSKPRRQLSEQSPLWKSQNICSPQASVRHSNNALYLYSEALASNLDQEAGNPDRCFVIFFFCSTTHILGYYLSMAWQFPSDSSIFYYPTTVKLL
jgi:hypothetical protein